MFAVGLVVGGSIVIPAPPAGHGQAGGAGRTVGRVHPSDGTRRTVRASPVARQQHSREDQHGADRLERARPLPQQHRGGGTATSGVRHM